MDSSEALRAAGLRRTPARLAVLDALRDAQAPLRHAALRAQPPLAALDEVTLYRTLTTLEGAGLLHRVQGLDGAWRYAPNRAPGAGCPGNHAHFLCATCGAMCCLVEQPMPRIQVPAGASVSGRSLLAWGRCAACAGVEGASTG
jgi:Fur family ferric uptake transcriptional regulator